MGRGMIFLPPTRHPACAIALLAALAALAACGGGSVADGPTKIVRSAESEQDGGDAGDDPEAGPVSDAAAPSFCATQPPHAFCLDFEDGKVPAAPFQVGKDSIVDVETVLWGSSALHFRSNYRYPPNPPTPFPSLMLEHLARLTWSKTQVAYSSAHCEFRVAIGAAVPNLSTLLAQLVMTDSVNATFYANVYGGATELEMRTYGGPTGKSVFGYSAGAWTPGVPVQVAFTVDGAMAAAHFEGPQGAFKQEIAVQPKLPFKAMRFELTNGGYSSVTGVTPAAQLDMFYDDVFCDAQ